jgi:hypothetical protein
VESGALTTAGMVEANLVERSAKFDQTTFFQSRYISGGSEYDSISQVVFQNSQFPTSGGSCSFTATDMDQA